MPATAGRPYPTHTKLGQIMSARGLRAVDVSTGSGIYTRTMSDLLSGKARPTPAQLTKLCAYFRVPPERLLEDEYPCHAQRRPEGRRRSHLASEAPILAPMGR